MLLAQKSDNLIGFLFTKAYSLETIVSNLQSKMQQNREQQAQMAMQISPQQQQLLMQQQQQFQSQMGMQRPVMHPGMLMSQAGMQNNPMCKFEHMCNFRWKYE